MSRAAAKKQKKEKLPNKIRQRHQFHVPMRPPSLSDLGKRQPADMREGPKRPFDHPLEGQPVTVICQ